VFRRSVPPKKFRPTSINSAFYFGLFHEKNVLRASGQPEAIHPWRRRSSIPFLLVLLLASASARSSASFDRSQPKCVDERE
jgi:hypothetical protein